ncbi:MAG: LytR C-terminal domain-containing protein, partial [Spirochaetia bacterium]|nr:LytR C-terminal domain-containing protein [Spirochaetia bacterium]
LEYALSRDSTLGANERYLSGLDRVYRSESTVMNLIWRKNRLKEQATHAKLQTFMHSLIKTDLSLPELRTLIAFLAPDEGVQINVMEVPLEAIPPGGAAPEGRLVVKEKRARSLFNEYRDNMSSGRLRPDSFPLEVLNGTDTKGLGRRIKQFLQDRGLQILVAENYRHKPLPRTVILERSGSTFVAEKLAEVTGIERDMVFFRRKTLDISASLLLGDDFNVKKMHLTTQ